MMGNIYESPFNKTNRSFKEISRLIENACRFNEYIDTLERNFYQNIDEEILHENVVNKISWNKISQRIKNTSHKMNFPFYKVNEGINEIKFITHKLISYKNIWMNEKTKKQQNMGFYEAGRDKPYRLIIDDNDSETEEKLKSLGYDVKQGYSTYIINLTSEGKNDIREIMVYEMPTSVLCHSDIIIKSLEEERSILIKYILGGKYPIYEVSLGGYYPIVGKDKMMIQKMLIRKEDKIKEYYDNKIFKQNEEVRRIIRERSLGES